MKKYILIYTALLFSVMTYAQKQKITEAISPSAITSANQMLLANDGTLKVSAAGSILIPAGSFLTVRDEITNLGDGTNFVVESDGALIQINDAAAANVGPITVKRISNMKRLDYTYWSSPVVEQTFKGFSPETADKRFYTYNEWDDKFTSVPNVNAAFTPAKGYAIRVRDYHTFSPTDWLGKFVGTPNNREYQIKLAKSGSTFGYNLVGNPYPSNINFDALVAIPGNGNLIYTAAYFWTNTNPNGAMQGSNYPNGALINNYAIYNGTGGAPATGATNSSKIPDGTIKVGQGFIVQTKIAGDLKFNNTIRDRKQGKFFDKSVPPDRFWLNLTTPLDIQSTILIGYIPAATNGLDLDYDAPLLVLGADALFTNLGSERLAIQGRQYPLNQSEVIPLGMSHYEAGFYTISLGNKEGIFNKGQNIYLKDYQTGLVTNLSATDYIYQGNKGLTENRFEILYQPQIVLGTDNVSKESLIVYRNGNDFVVKSPNNKITEVEMYDVSGRLIYKVRPNNNMTTIPAESIGQGVYILKINQEGEFSTRKILK